MEPVQNVGIPNLVGLASKIRNIDGKPLRSAIRVAAAIPNSDSVMDKVSSCKDDTRVFHANPSFHTDGCPSLAQEENIGTPFSGPAFPVNKDLGAASFANITKTRLNKKVIKIQELRSNVQVDGAAVAIPLEEVQAVSARFANTLYGYFIGKRLAFPLVENYVKNAWAKYGFKRIQLHEEFFLFQFDTKEGMESVLEDGPWMIRREPLMLNVWSQNTDLKKAEITKAPVWVKLHHVPIVAYSEVGLSLIATQIGKPVMLDSYTSNMCVSSWGRNTYARILIEVSAELELKKELIVAIPIGMDKGHSLSTISIEYEWKPPRCSTCLVFDHVPEKCPKLPKEVQIGPIGNDGFQDVKKKRSRPKSKQQKQVDGVILSKPSLNLHFRKVAKSSKSEQPKPTPKPNNCPNVNKDKISVSTSNKFNALDDEADIWGNNGKSIAINESDSDDVGDLSTLR